MAFRAKTKKLFLMQAESAEDKTDNNSKMLIK